MVEKYNLSKIKPEIIDINSCDLSEDFVALSADIDENGTCFHSGLVICYDGELNYFHYTGKEVLLDKLNIVTNNYNLYLKKLDIISSLDVVSFLGHCEKLLAKGVLPSYGFVFNNSYYDSTTKDSFLTNAVHDITTCVGFCIKVIRGFLFNNTEYILLSDWNISSLNGLNPDLINYIDFYLKVYATQNNTTVSQLYSHNELKRVTPSELLASGYYLNLPILKESIDHVKPELERHIVSYKVA